MAGIQRIKGFADLFSPESDAFAFMEGTARRVFSSYGYSELRVPIMEPTELFVRGIGTETDIVQKEMYTFPDRKGRSLTLRPEATAGVMRAYAEAGCNTRESVSKFFTYGPMFRYERPQKGRMRQFHQINCECVGASEPVVDAEVILMLMTFLGELGLTGLSLEINSLGCKECRPEYRRILGEFLAKLNPDDLCEDCRRRMSINPLRVLDCKVSSCKAQVENAPRIAEHNCPDCTRHFTFVREVLDKTELSYVLNHRLVRGLDYYNRTTFEVVSSSIGAQGSVAGGGRYDGLVNALGGPDVPGVGFACGMERLAMMLQIPERTPEDFYIAVLDDAALETAVLVAQQLRFAGKRGQISFAAKSLKSQMRQASKLNVKKCLIIGSNELAAEIVAVKDMATGEQQSVSMNAITAAI